MRFLPNQAHQNLTKIESTKLYVVLTQLQPCLRFLGSFNLSVTLKSFQYLLEHTLFHQCKNNNIDLSSN